MTTPAHSLVSERLAALDATISALEAHELVQRAHDAARLRLLAAALDTALTRPSLGSGELAHRSLRAEVATALRRSEGAVDRELSLAAALGDRFPGTLLALERGDISLGHVRVLVDTSAPLGASANGPEAPFQARFEAEVLTHATHETPQRLRPLARRIAGELAEELARELERTHPDLEPPAPLCRRGVRLVEAGDGFSELIATLPTVEAHAIHDRLSRLAKAADAAERASRDAGLGTRLGPGSDSDSGTTPTSVPVRSLDEARADVLRDLLLAANPHELFAGSPEEAVRARIQLVLPVRAPRSSGTTVPTVRPDGHPDTSRPTGLTGTDPRGFGHDLAELGGAELGGAELGGAELAGSGPISSGTARGYARHTVSWERVTVAEHSGTVLSVDRYRPDAAMQRFLGARDLHCRFPGCRVPLARCDIDHTVDAARGGPTSTDNLAHLCRGHHTLKHATPWSVEQFADGTLVWRSPTGREHRDRPPSRVRFAEAQGWSSSTPQRPSVRGHPQMSEAPGILSS